MKVFLFLIAWSVTLFSNEQDILALGEQVYNETCISCHGKDGATNPDMQLVVKPRVLQKSILNNEQSFYIIKHGAHMFGANVNIMPAFKYVYEDKKIVAVALYISKTFNKNRDTRIKKLLDASVKLSKEEQKNALKVGEKIFLRKCAMCHGDTGNGESEYVELSKANKSFIYPYNLQKTLLSQDQIFLYAKYGGHYWGTHEDDMPSWKKRYNDVKLKSIAKYITEKIKRVKP